MLELRLENPQNIYSDRYAVFSKHRRGDVGVRLYYDLSVTGDVYYNADKFEQDANCANCNPQHPAVSANLPISSTRYLTTKTKLEHE